MANKPKKLSDTAREPLTVAAMRGDHLIRPPKLPIAAARQVVRSLLGAGLAEETPVRVEDPDYAWRTSEDGEVLMLRATALGLTRVGEGETVTPTPEPIAAETWETTRDAGAAVVAPAPLVTDLAPCCQQVQDGPEGARGLHCGLGDVPVSLHRFDSVLAAVGLGRPCAGRSVSGRGLGHSRLQQAAQVFLGAWNARACL